MQGDVPSPEASKMAAYSKAVIFSTGLIPAFYICYHFSWVALTLLLCTLGVVCGSSLALFTGRPRGIRRRSTYQKYTDSCIAKGRITSVKQYPSSPSVPVMFSISLDSKIQEVLDLIHRHHLAPFYSRFGSDHEQFYRSLQPEAWSFLAALKDRLYKVDMLQLMSQDTVNVFIDHLQWLKKFGVSAGGDGTAELQTPFQPNLDRFPYLASAEDELNFVRQVCDVLLCVTLPRSILHCSAVRSLTREFLLAQIVLPSVERLCDPDFLNQHLLAYLEQREKGAKKAKNKYAKAATYEEFVKYLEKCSSVEELQHTRELILIDMVQARAVMKMKNERVHTGSLAGPDIPMPTEKVEQLRSRKNLPAYVKQLRNCMQVCDKCIKKLGGGGGEIVPGLLSAANQLHSSTSPALRLSFDQLLSSPEYRKAFASFLSDHGGAHHVLACWEELDQLREQQQKDGSSDSTLSQIYSDYFAFSAPRFVDLDPSLAQRVRRVTEEGSGSGGRDAGAVGEVMRRLASRLQCQFYHSFLCSPAYLQLRQRTLQSGGGSGGGGVPEDLPRDPAHSFSPDPLLNMSFSEEVEEGRHEKRLRELKQKLKDIEHLLEELPASAAKVEGASQRRKALEKQQKAIIEEQHQLENYLDRMSDWYGSIGQWTVTVSLSDLADSTDPLFMILIGHSSATAAVTEQGEWTSDATFEDLSTLSSFSSSPFFDVVQEPTTRRVSSASSSKMSEVSERASVCSETSNEDASTSGRYRDGWIVNRKLSEFKTLHARLSQMNGLLKFPKPLLQTTKSFMSSLSMFPSSNASKGDADLSQYSSQLTEYLGRVVTDEKLQGCELVFLFLSPPYQLILGQGASEGERKMSLSIPSALREILPRLKVESLVDPWFSLMVEIFELGDWKMVFRKRLVNLIQFAFGSDLDRQVQEAVAWYVSEPMMVHYLEVLRDSLWPDGAPRAPPTSSRSEDDRRHTRDQVRAKILKNPPFFVQSIVGSQNCQVGLEKIFLSFQNPCANRQLFFAFLEVLMRAVVPELQDIERDLQESTTPT